MKKAVKKVTKKEAAIPKGKAVAGKGKAITKDKTPAAIEFKLTDKVAQGGRPLYVLFVKGKKTNCLFTGIRKRYQEYNDEKVEALKALKGINCMDVPENMTISLTLRYKLIIGEVTFVEFSRKGKELDLSYSIFMMDDELLKAQLNPIRIYKEAISGFVDELIEKVECSSELKFDVDEDSIIFITFKYPRSASGKLGFQIEDFPSLFDSILKRKVNAIMEELVPTKKKK